MSWVDPMGLMRCEQSLDCPDCPCPYHLPFGTQHDNMPRRASLKPCRESGPGAWETQRLDVGQVAWLLLFLCRDRRDLKSRRLIVCTCPESCLKTSHHQWWTVDLDSHFAVAQGIFHDFLISNVPVPAPALRFVDRTETARGERTNSTRTAVDFNGYQSIFTDARLGKDTMSKQQCKQAWLRGLSDPKKEPFKRQVWVEKLGKYELRDHLWIEMPAVLGGSLTKGKRLGWIGSEPCLISSI